MPTLPHNHPSPGPQDPDDPEAWPSEPLPHPGRGEGSQYCNAPLLWSGKVMGHCTRRVRTGKTHRGKHAIEWDS